MGCEANDCGVSPICSMYGIYLPGKLKPNVGKYTIREAYGSMKLFKTTTNNIDICCEAATPI